MLLPLGFPSWAGLLVLGRRARSCCCQAMLAVPGPLAPARLAVLPPPAGWAARALSLRWVARYAPVGQASSPAAGLAEATLTVGLLGRGALFCF